MRLLYKIAALFAGMIITAVAFTACEFDNSPEPDFPTFVSYAITAECKVTKNMPAQLLQDINAWIEANRKIYDKEMSYSTGEKSEFAKGDTEANQKYDVFKGKFEAYLDSAKVKLADGQYGNISTPVTATFIMYARRQQGKETLRYDQIEFVYPDSSSEKTQE